MSTVETTEDANRDWSSFPALGRALRLDTAEDELVTLLMDIGGYMARDFGDAPPPLLTLLAKMRADARDLASHRVLNDEYQRLIAESNERGRIVLRRIPLWLVDTRTGKLTHDHGYLLSGERGGSYLVEHGGRFDIEYGGEVYQDRAFTSASDAADCLERWAKKKRDELNEAYRALAMLAEEATPQATEKLRAQARRR